MDEERFLAAAGKPGRPKGRSFGGYVEIDAPADFVWSIAGDWQGWSAWNPLYTSTSGEPRVGNEIEFTVALPGMKPSRGKATVFTYRPDGVLEYGLTNMAGLLRAFRFVEIEVLGPARCGVANGEIMSGPLGALVGMAAGPKVGEGLRAMNAKLKEIAEARWRAVNA